MPETADKALLKYYIMTISDVFEKIRPGRPVQMIGDGIILYPRTRPERFARIGIFLSSKAMPDTAVPEN